MCCKHVVSRLLVFLVFTKVGWGEVDLCRLQVALSEFPDSPNTRIRFQSTVVEIVGGGQWKNTTTLSRFDRTSLPRQHSNDAEKRPTACPRQQHAVR